ncbi:MAG: rubrerythrin family protein [Candidatus Methanomethyliaceae archaeon]
MKKMSEENLKAAFAGQSQAHMRYLIFAEVAEKEGKPNLARLFRAIAYAEQVHATDHFRELGMIRDSGQNLDVAIAGETYEVEEMYPAFIAVADLQKESGAKRAFHFAIEAEKIHAELYKKVKKAAEKGADIKIGTVYICPVCGHTVVGEPPERCPICGAPREKYKAF